MINSGVKKSKKYVRKPVKSLRTYIKQNRSTALIMFFGYLVTILVLIFGGLSSSSIIYKHFQIKNKNQTEKERFVTQIVYQMKN